MLLKEFQQIEEFKKYLDKMEQISNYSYVKGYINCLQELKLLDNNFFLNVTNNLFRDIFNVLEKEELTSFIDKIDDFRELIEFEEGVEK